MSVNVYVRTTGNKATAATGAAGVAATTAAGTHATKEKASLLDKVNPKKDADGDGKAGFMK